MSPRASIPLLWLPRACWALPLLLAFLLGSPVATAATPARSVAAAFVSPTHHERSTVTKGIDRRRSSHYYYLSAEASQQHSTSSSSSLTNDSASTTSTAPPSSSSSSNNNNNNKDNDPLGLTPELRKLTNAFQAIGDDKLRYKQLLYMANQLAPMNDQYKIPQNKVPGCLSTVHVHATVVGASSSPEENGGVPLIQFIGDSDGLLTKGLVAFLVRGLSGNSAQAIQAVDPAFIQQAGIAASLTPGRNNGFLNMLAVMKQKALVAVEEAEAVVATEAPESTGPTATQPPTPTSSRPKYDAIIAALQPLQPVQLELVDNSHQHAGHAGASPEGESHFDLYIVADAFDGLNLVKRHKLVYMMLGDLMPRIHALQIRAQTPAEAAEL